MPTPAGRTVACTGCGANIRIPANEHPAAPRCLRCGPAKRKPAR